jgi:translation initiation factor 3 subunit A
LTEFLKQHFSEYQSQDTYHLLMNTKFKQMEVATDIELWQEAFKTVEEIYELLKISKLEDKVLKVKYLKSLQKIFWVSKKFVFYSFTSLKLYSEEKEKNQ